MFVAVQFRHAARLCNSVALAGSQLSCRVRTNAAGGLERLLLLRDPVADVLDVIENEAAYFRAWRAQASSSEALQRAHRTMELSRQFGFANLM